MQLDLPTREYAGYIFDLDGTLIDSMPMHYESWCEALRNASFPHRFEEDLFYSLGGVPTARIIEILNARHHTNLDPSAMARAKEEIYLRRLPQIPLLEPVVEFARARHAAGRPTAVASGGSRPVVEAALRATEIRDLFSVITTPEDVVHGKPAPDLFLLAAQRMGVPPHQCIVFEDAEPGRQAAVAAGMDYVLIPGARERAAAARAGT